MPFDEFRKAAGDPLSSLGPFGVVSQSERRDPSDDAIRDSVLLDRSADTVGFGVEAEISRGVSLRASYDGEFSDRTRAHSFSGKLSVAF